MSDRSSTGRSGRDALPSASRLSRLYFLLAFCCLLFVLGSLYAVDRITSAYSGAIAGDQSWFLQLQGLGELEGRAQEMKDALEPFYARAPREEEVRAIFPLMDRFRRQLFLVEEQLKAGREVPPQVEHLFSSVREDVMALERRVAVEASALIRAAGQPEPAGRVAHSSAMHEWLLSVIRTVDDMEERIGVVKAVVLNEEREKARELAAFERLTGWSALLLLCFAAGYGVKVHRETRADLAEREHFIRRLTRQAALLDKAQNAIVMFDTAGIISYWNKGAEEIFGWSAQDVMEKPAWEMLFQNRASVAQEVGRCRPLTESVGQIAARRKDGTEIFVEARQTLVTEGGTEFILCICTDITERRAAEEKIQNLAFYDQLTLLPNRQLLMDRLKHAMAVSNRSGTTIALMFLDLDRFKQLNDTMGHDYGDLLLKQVAGRLNGSVRECDTVARLGGDEFVVILEELSSDREEAARQAQMVAEKIGLALDQPHALWNHQHRGAASIGLVLCQGHEFGIEALLKRADFAMYQAKAGGRNTVRFYDLAMEEIADNRAAMEEDLREGLNCGQFFLVYQPQIDQWGNTTGVEALVRWQHPRRGTVTPAEFIPLAEETGLVLPLGRMVLKSVLKQLAEWERKPATAALTISVNVSPVQFLDASFVPDVLEIVEACGVPARRLKLELTERMFLQDVEGSVAKMRMLKEHGIQFSLDDFGVGYSSLAYLKRLPLDQLKIDQSFTREAVRDRDSAAIVATIIALGMAMGLDVVAEGVETQEQRDFLFSHGCHAYQGYLFARPQTVGELDAFLLKAGTVEEPETAME